MLRVWEQMKNVLQSEKGQGMVEYALIIALVGVILIGSLQALEGGIDGAFTNAINAL